MTDEFRLKYLSLEHLVNFFNDGQERFRLVRTGETRHNIELIGEAYSERGSFNPSGISHAKRKYYVMARARHSLNVGHGISDSITERNENLVVAFDEFIVNDLLTRLPVYWPRRIIEITAQGEQIGVLPPQVHVTRNDWAPLFGCLPKWMDASLPCLLRKREQVYDRPTDQPPIGYVSTLAFLHSESHKEIHYAIIGRQAYSKPKPTST